MKQILDRCRGQHEYDNNVSSNILLFVNITVHENRLKSNFTVVYSASV